MTVLHAVFAVGAFLCGLRALGYWVILQLSGVRSPERGSAALVACGAALLFVVLSTASAYFLEQGKGPRAIAARALYLAGVYGLPPIAIFTVASRGAVLHMPEVVSLLILFVCCVLEFRPRMPQHGR